jgi:heme-degrading monooxygenase HmoA
LSRRDIEVKGVIARTWRGWTAAADADRYMAYLEETGLREYRETPGNRGVLVLRRVVGAKAEFLLVSFWESHDAIRAFAGDDIEEAVYYPEDEAFLVDRELHVAHFDVLSAPPALDAGD